MTVINIKYERMNIKPIVLAISLLTSLSGYSQDAIPDSADNPILGYYHLGMTLEEAISQDDKIRKNTEVPNFSGSVLSQYLMEINGINFDVDRAGTGAEIDHMGYENYGKETLPLYFTGGAYYLDGKLVSLTIKSAKTANDLDETFLCYMPASLYSQKNLPSNRCLFDVQKPEQHNKITNQADGLTSYLSKKYGTPLKENKIPLLLPLQKDDVAIDNFKVQWYSLCQGNAVLPRAEWHQGNMTIIMGISSDATLFISFLDEQALSHSNLDKYFKPAEPPKANATW